MLPARFLSWAGIYIPGGEQRRMIPLLLDTDIGSDIDDALALTYLLCQPECALLGVTTVTGQPEVRASLAEALCRAAGQGDVPIHVGAAKPLLLPVRQPDVPQAAALTAQWPHRTFGGENTAAEFMRRTICERPGEVTLLAIGPLTNIALLFALDRGIPALLRRVVLMGGQYYRRAPGRGVAEWNILNDPHAAAIVFGADVPLTAVGLDVTTQCVLSSAQCAERLAAAQGPLALARAMAGVWLERVPQVTFHDPLAAALLFRPDLCAVQPERVQVELVSLLALGQTVCAQDPAERPHGVASSVGVDAFFQHYFSVVNG